MLEGKISFPHYGPKIGFRQGYVSGFPGLIRILSLPFFVPREGLP
jgi:hypothetical protein